MDYKEIDINTIVVDGITYTAVEHCNCSGCEFERTTCPPVICSSTGRLDQRSIIWKRKMTDIQNKSSSKHTKPIDIKVVNENKIIVDGVEYQPTDNIYGGCAGCAFRNKICSEYSKSIPCTVSERKDGLRVIWEKVPDKQIHVSLSEIKQTKKKVYKLNFKP